MLDGERVNDVYVQDGPGLALHILCLSFDRSCRCVEDLRGLYGAHNNHIFTRHSKQTGMTIRSHPALRFTER